jgi:hypothetical protein
MKNLKNYLLLILFLIILCCVVFSIIYYAIDDTDSYENALYLSVQIQTSVGIDIEGVKDRAGVRNWITVQSILAYTLNILVVVFIAEYISRFIFLSKTQI